MSAPGLISKGFGPTDVGFLRPPQADILADHEERFTAELGPIDLDPRSPEGQDAGIHTGSDDDLWQLAEACSNQHDPRTVTGDAQDRLYALLEIVRKAATPSIGEVTVTGAAATVLASGRAISSPDGALEYVTTAGATLAAVTARIASSTITTGAFRKNSGNVYVALVGGVAGAGAGPVGTTHYPTVETDGGVTWAFVGPGDGFATVAMESIEDGRIAGPAFGLTVIQPTAGISGAANLTDVVMGSAREEDEDFRARYFSEIATGLATVDAILRGLLDLDGNEEARVFENTSHEVDSDGLAPHSIEAVVRGTDSSTVVCTSLFDTKPAGIKTNGNTSESIADIRGGLHSISYTEPEDLEIYLVLDIEADRRLWPSELLSTVSARGTGRAKAAVLAFGSADLNDGRDVDPSAISSAIHRGLPGSSVHTGVPGTLSVVVKLGLAPNPTATDRIPVTLRQIARLDSTRTTVNVSYRTP